jgi:isopentenyl diphosphate isomerase/L-lactate dehydrogenase-like FMN-dependent dehydrogenase
LRDVANEIRTVDDARYLAMRRLPPSLVNQIEGGSGLGTTLDANLAAFAQLEFNPRAAMSFPTRDLSTTVLGHAISMPLMLAPTANVRFYHPDGEPGLARAAGAAGTIACISSLTGYPIEEVVAASRHPVFFQIYYIGGRANVETMIERAKRAGVQALILTVDSAAWYMRERTARDRLQGPTLWNWRAFARFAPQVLRHPSWFSGFLRDGMRDQAPMALHANGRPFTSWEANATMACHTPVWDDVSWIRERFGGPVIVKGVISPEDARRAVASGASAIVVSNHGGNALDGTPPTLRMLPSIVDAVGDEVEVLLDSGVRRGGDVVKALALGARAVLVGRATLWSHAAAGSAGVRQMLEVFRRNIDRVLALLGCPSVHELDRSYVYLPADWAGMGAERPKPPVGLTGLDPPVLGRRLHRP